MLSELELRSIIEGSFLPKRCECTKAEDASLTIKVYDDRDRDRVDLESQRYKRRQTRQQSSYLQPDHRVA